MTNDNYDGAKWKNINDKVMQNRISVSSELLRSYNNNDLFLLSQTNELWDTTSIKSRKHFNTIPIDKIKSYNVTDKGNSAEIDNSTSQNIKIAFDNDMLDTQKTTAVIDANHGNAITAPVKYDTSVVTDKSTRNYSQWCKFEPGHDGDFAYLKADAVIVNAYWYISMDKAKRYLHKPEWMKDPYSPEIPAIVRAQVFKANKTGKIEGLELNLMCDGTNGENHPLEIDIIKCEKKTVKGEDIYFPKSCLDLTESDYIWKHVKVPTDIVGGGSRYTIKHELGGMVQAGEHYSIVVRSPLTNPKNCYRLGGWGKNCEAYPYPDGSAFLSENNGRDWIRHGKPDKVEYYLGKRAPVLFSFCVYIAVSTTEISTSPCEVYTKAINTNPCKYLQLNADVSDMDKGTIEWELYDNQNDSWNHISNNTGKFFNGTGNELPDLFLIKAKITPNNNATAPKINNIHIHVDTEKAISAVLRTTPYVPVTNGLLASNIISKLNSPVDLKNNYHSSVLVDIVSETNVSENFKLIEFDTLPKYEELSATVKRTLEEINKIIKLKDSEKTEAIKVYLINNPQIRDELYALGVYLLDDEEFDGVNLKNNVASPLLYVALLCVDGENKGYSEWIDYEVDYETNEIVFTDRVLNEIEAGDLHVEYNPVFLKNIEQQEMPINLDVFIENFTINESIISNGLVLNLRADMLDPLRGVFINADTPDEIELVEDVDYTVDWDKKAVTLNNSNAFPVGTKVTIKYTPELKDSSISLEYRLNRTNTDDNIIIKPFYIETRT